MIKKHSTVSRRDFMKGLGLAGAGIGAAAVSTPVFHDLDELISSAAPQASLHRPWYIKNREFGDVGIEIDWDNLKRRDQSHFSNWDPPTIIHDYPGGLAGFQDKLTSSKKAVEDKTKEIWPDYRASVRDVALGSAISAVGVRSYYSTGLEMPGGAVEAKIVPIATPEELGMPKWEGTPEENLMMVRAALSVVGLGPALGAAELTERNRNFVWEYTPFAHDLRPSERIIFDDNITKSYRVANPAELHIPSSFRNVIATHNMSCDELHRRPFSGCGVTGMGGEPLSYSRVSFAKSFFDQFLRGIGYGVVYGHKLQPSAIWDLLAGVAEHSRTGSAVISPEYGGLMRTHCIFYTDLPLAFTPPTDAGITRFCETCGICADVCPVGSIAPVGVGRSWDNACGQNWADDIQEGGTKVMYNIPGYKGWRNNLFQCTAGSKGGCGAACKASCPFNTIPDGSFMHSIVKATASTTSIFNGFFRNMEEMMKYGFLDKEPSSWWETPEAWHVYGTHPALLEQ